MRSVWIVEDGEYEQRGIWGVFETEALARMHIEAAGLDEEPVEYEAWNRRPKKVTQHHWRAVHGAVLQPILADYATPKNEPWETLECHAPTPVCPVRLAWWSSRKRCDGIFVEVYGTDAAGTEAAFREAWAEVQAGRTPDEIAPC